MNANTDRSVSPQVAPIASQAAVAPTICGRPLAQAIPYQEDALVLH